MSVVDTRVSILTTSLRTEFQVSYEAVAKPAPWEKYTQVIPSTARIEHYTWMSPAPGLGLYAGHRRYGKVDTVRYSVENKEFDAGFEVLLRDVQDDQTGGYVQKPKELARRAALFPGRWVIKHLAAGESRSCFDGTNFFADTHAIGTGDNLLSATGSANSDGLVYKAAFLFTGGPLKPLLWQNRKGPDFETTAGSPQSKEAKMLRYWIDMEGEAAYGYWWDAVLVKITNLPTVTELHNVIRDALDAFRTFTLPKSAASEDGEYVHEQEEFDQNSVIIVGATKLSSVFKQALGQEWIPQTVGSSTVATTNLWQGVAAFIPSAFMNP